MTLVRDGTPEVSVLGITARLVGVDGNQATIEVAGQTVMVPVGGEFPVRASRCGWSATDADLVVRISR